MTSFGTVRLGCNNDAEMLLEDFVKKLEKKTKKKTKSKKYVVKWNDNSVFSLLYVKYKGKVYYFNFSNRPCFDNCLDKKKYNEAIARLINLANISRNIEKEKKRKAKIKEKQAEIIEDAEKGIFSDDRARTIYLDELKNRETLLNAFKYTFKELVCGGNFKGYLCREFFSSGLCGVVGGLFGHFFAKGFLAGGKIGALVGLLSGPVIAICDTLWNYRDEKKITKHKIRELEKSLNIDKSKSNKKVKKKNKHKNKNVVINNNEVQESIKSYLYNFKDTIYHKVSGLLDKIDSLKNNDKVRTQRKTKTHGKNKVQTKTIPSISINFGEQVKSYPYNFKDTIYQRASGLLDKIDSLNNDVEKKELKGKINGILQEYRTGLTLEQNVGPVELSVSKCKSIPDLKSEIRNKLGTRLGSKLDNIDTYINEMLEKQITESEREKERLLLEERLGPVVIDSEEIDGTLRERAENKVPVRGKKRII